MRSPIRTAFGCFKNLLPKDRLAPDRQSSISPRVSASHDSLPRDIWAIMQDVGLVECRSIGTRRNQFLAVSGLEEIEDWLYPLVDLMKANAPG